MPKTESGIALQSHATDWEPINQDNTMTSRDNRCSSDGWMIKLVVAVHTIITQVVYKEKKRRQKTPREWLTIRQPEVSSSSASSSAYAENKVFMACVLSVRGIFSRSIPILYKLNVHKRRTNSFPPQTRANRLSQPRKYQKLQDTWGAPKGNVIAEWAYFRHVGG